MLNFIIGRSGTGKSAAVREMICRDVEAKRQVVLIVPEQETVVWETKMAEMLPVSANLCLEITNFTRLANSVFRQYGGLTDVVIDEGSRSLLVWRAMLSVWESLEVYGSSGTGEREDRNIPHLMRAIDELKESGISPAEAEEALDKLIAERDADSGGEERGTDGDLISRLRDAVLVYSAYNSILHEEYIDRGDLLANLGEKLKKCGYFENKSVYIDSFYSFTKAQLGIISSIFRRCDDCTVTFMCPPSVIGKSYEREGDETEFDISENESSSQEMQFDEIRDSFSKIRAIASRLGLEWRAVSMTENLRHKENEELALVEKYLFDYSAAEDDSGADENGENIEEKTRKKAKNVHIWRCSDKYDEAEACAAIIDKLVYEGYKYNEIGVVARDISTREGVIDSAIRRHGVRCFMSVSSEISRTPAVRFVLAALSLIAGGWQREDIICLIKTGMTPLGKADDGEWEEDILERYTATWKISGRRMYTADDWSMNPDGYKTEITDRGMAILKAVNEAKNKLIPPLETLAEAFDGGMISARQIAEKIVQIAETYDVVGSLEVTAEAYEKIGQFAMAEKCRKSWAYVCEILDKMVEILGDCEMGAAGFASLFARAASAMDTGTIPTAVDEVVLGSSSGVRIDSPKCIIILGSVEGEFPGNVSDERNFFGDSDKIALENVGLNLSSPDVNLLTAREMFMYYRTAALPTEQLFVLIPSSGGENPSEGARRIEEIFEKRKIEVVESFGEIPLDEVVYSRKTAEFLLPRRSGKADREFLRSIIDSDEKSKVQNSLTSVGENVNNDENLGVIVDPDGTRRLMLSQSKIETYLACPFNYVCRYLLKLEPEPTSEIRSVDVGNFVHKILEKFFVSIPSARLRSDDFDRDEIRKTAEEIINDYIAELERGSGRSKAANVQTNDARVGYLYNKLKVNVISFIEAIVAEIRQSQFETAANEVPIGLKGSKIEPIGIEASDGTKVVLNGIADRIDTYKASDGRIYFRIVDYKTGSKTFSLEEMKFGYGLQMMIYLFSIWKYAENNVENDEVLPAGAQYYITKPAVVTRSDESSLKFDEETRKIEKSGIFTLDEEVLRAIDASLEGEFIPIKSGKDGLLKSSQKNSVLIEAAKYAELGVQLNETAAKIADQILSGKADVKPKARGGKLPCEWCENKYVCKVKV